MELYNMVFLRYDKEPKIGLVDRKVIIKQS